MLNTPKTLTVTPTAALEVKKLRKLYHTKDASLVAVDDISFSVSAGECFGLLGPNGAGKSTTMKCVTGFFQPTAGVVRICGVDVHRDPKLARLELGVCAQEANLDSDFNVFDQLVQFASFFGLNRRESTARSEELIERFQLSELRSRPIESLSGGQQRRLQLARALINRPRLLVLDEPSTGLDPEARRLVWDILLAERKCGLSILLSTHYMDEAQRLCDLVAIMHRGVILTCDPPEVLIAREVGNHLIEEEMRPGVRVKRAANLEDVYLKLTGAPLGQGAEA